MNDLSNILARLGTIRNPILGSALPFCISMMFFSKDLVLSPNLIPTLTGAAMFILAVVVFLLALGFYFYAFINLPATTQELVFLQEAKAAVERHNKKTGKITPPEGTEVE